MSNEERKRQQENQQNYIDALIPPVSTSKTAKHILLRLPSQILSTINSFEKSLKHYPLRAWNLRFPAKPHFETDRNTQSSSQSAPQNQQAKRNAIPTKQAAKFQEQCWSSYGRLETESRRGKDCLRRHRNIVEERMQEESPRVSARNERGKHSPHSFRQLAQNRFQNIASR